MNNLQNEKITFETASSNDIWLHAKQYHSAHTIIINKGENIPEKVILSAAKLTAYLSDGKQSGKIEIDYTRKKNVKRHPAGKTGLVIYTDFHSILCQPYTDEEIKELLENN